MSRRTVISNEPEERIIEVQEKDCVRGSTIEAWSVITILVVVVIFLIILGILIFVAYKSEQVSKDADDIGSKVDSAYQEYSTVVKPFLDEVTTDYGQFKISLCAGPLGGYFKSFCAGVTGPGGQTGSAQQVFLPQFNGQGPQGPNFAPNMVNQNPMNQNLMNQNLMNQNLMNQNLMNQNLMNQNPMNQNLMNQNLMNQNLPPYNVPPNGNIYNNGPNYPNNNFNQNLPRGRPPPAYESPTIVGSQNWNPMTGQLINQRYNLNGY